MMEWMAIAVFFNVADCDAFVETHDLQKYFDQQCTLVETGYLAPATSPRPAPKPEQ